MSKLETSWYSENIDLFQKFCFSEEDSDMGGSEEHWEKGKYIYQVHDPARKIYLLLEGKVKVGTFSQKGKEIIKYLIRAGDIFGELILAGEETRTNFAQVLETGGRAVSMNLAQLKAAMDSDNAFSRRISQLVAHRLAQTEGRVDGLIAKDATTRVKDFLLQLAEEEGIKDGGNIVIEHFFTHQDIANLTATSRQTVTTILNQFRDEGWLHFDRKKVTIKRPEGSLVASI